MGSDAYQIKRVPRIIRNWKIIEKHRAEEEAREEENEGKEKSEPGWKDGSVGRAACLQA